MAVNSFKIKVEKSPVVYSPGETITGKVFVTLNRKKSFRGIKLRFKGRAKVNWKKSGIRDDSSDSDSSEEYKKEEHYFRKVIYVVGNSQEEVELVAGQHIFPFTFLLPANIPNSFYHEFGQVEYEIKGIMTITWAMKYRAYLPIKVFSPLDLSDAPSMSIIDEVHQEYGLCLIPCMSRGYMEAQIRIPRRTLDIGDQLEVHIDVEIKSESVEVMAIEVHLKKTLQFHAESKTKSRSEIVQSAEKRGPLRSNSSVKLELQVPKVRHSGLQYCSIIDIMYCLGVKLIVSECYRDTERKYDIEIGSRSIATAPHLSKSSVPPNGPMDWPLAEFPAPLSRFSMINSRNHNRFVSNQPGIASTPV